jgi:proline racemase
MIFQYDPSKEYKSISTIDAHAAGEPLRVIVEGLNDIPGITILDKRRYMLEHFDHLRRALMAEPRGHADMYGAVLTEPLGFDSDIGVIFIHNEGYSTMCGHGIIALTKIVLDMKIVKKKGSKPTLNIDTPAGLVAATARRKNNIVHTVSFKNVPSFVFAQDLSVKVPHLGQVTCDIAFGGAFYAFVDATELNLALTPANAPRIVKLGMKIKKAVADAFEIIHPDEEELGFLYGTIFTAPPQDIAHHARNVCVFADGQLDRSPTGTGISALAAIHHFNGALSLGQPLTIESIIGTTFDVKVINTAEAGPYPAVIPQVTGTAHITGHHEFIIDPNDPLAQGFLIR